jgi:hypothetical protein
MHNKGFFEGREEVKTLLCIFSNECTNFELKKIEVLEEVREMFKIFKQIFPDEILKGFPL